MKALNAFVKKLRNAAIKRCTLAPSRPLGKHPVADKGWKREFEDPIPLPDGRMLVTLLDAGEYTTTLPKAEQQLDEWQAAIEALMVVVQQRGPTMFARIGVMRAPNRQVERVFNPDRKETHWGKRKLKRDQ
jgi:hypothetical protein